MTTPRRVRYQPGPNSTWFGGPPQLLIPAFKAARTPRQWDGQRRGWLIPARFANDVIAALEHRSGDGVVELIQVDEG